MEISEKTEAANIYDGRACAVFGLNGVERAAEVDIEFLYDLLQHNQDSEKTRATHFNLNDLQSVLERMCCSVNDKSGAAYQENSNSSPQDVALTVPPEVLRALQELNLSSNIVNNFSLVIGILFNLTVLRITNSNLQQLPENINLLVNLKELDLPNNKLCELPASVGKLKNMRSINVSSNHLKFLPDAFGHLDKLYHLNISDNCFTEIPQCLYIGLTNISFLDMSINHITSFHLKPNCATKLKVLRVDHNNLMHFPYWILDDTCKCLMEVNLSANIFMLGLTEEQFILSSDLQRLNLSDCMLNNANASFLQQLNRLLYLNLGNSLKCLEDRATYGNSFWEFPLTPGDCCYLQELVMSGVGLSMLPEDVEKFQALEYGDFSHNSLSWIPETFCKLMTLHFANLSNNEIWFLPDELGCLVLLKELCLDGNRICELPESIINLKNLEHLDLYNNAFENFPQEIFKLPKLKRFDVDRNFFELSETLLSDSQVQTYAEMKCSLRNYRKWNIKQREDGRKLPTERRETDPDSDSESANSQSLVSESCTRQVSTSSSDFKEINDEEEEDWDIEADFDENFDPSLIPGRGFSFETKRNTIIVEDVRTSQDDFCPSDKHVVPLSKLRNFNRLHIAMITVEGQFDDAD